MSNCSSECLRQRKLTTPPLQRVAALPSARPAVTFPTAEHHRPLAGTKLYCLVTEAHRCEQLAQGCYAAFAPSTFWTRDLLIASPTLYLLRHRAIFYREERKDFREEDDKTCLAVWRVCSTDDKLVLLFLSIVGHHRLLCITQH